jgi:hypothetical protein
MHPIPRRPTSDSDTHSRPSQNCGTDTISLISSINPTNNRQLHFPIPRLLPDTPLLLNRSLSHNSTPRLSLNQRLPFNPLLIPFPTTPHRCSLMQHFTCRRLSLRHANLPLPSKPNLTPLTPSLSRRWSLPYRSRPCQQQVGLVCRSLMTCRFQNSGSKEIRRHRPNSRHHSSSLQPCHALTQPPRRRLQPLHPLHPPHPPDPFRLLLRALDSLLLSL